MKRKTSLERCAMQVNVTYYFKKFAYGGGTITTTTVAQKAFEKG
jgi:hypothetical protein